MTKIEILNNAVQRYCENKEESNELKKLLDEDAKVIKSNITNGEWKSGIYTVTVKEIVTEDFDEGRLIEKLKTIDPVLASEIVKTKEYVDMEVLENVIYNGLIDPIQLTDCKISKKSSRLTFKRNK